MEEYSDCSARQYEVLFKEMSRGEFVQTQTDRCFLMYTQSGLRVSVM